MLVVIHVDNNATKANTINRHFVIANKYNSVSREFKGLSPPILSKHPLTSLSSFVLLS